MSDAFNQEQAREDHQQIILAAQHIRDGLTKDIIDYYYNAPTSAEHDREQRDGMRKYLRIASERIHELLNGKLY